MYIVNLAVKALTADFANGLGLHGTRSGIVTLHNRRLKRKSRIVYSRRKNRISCIFEQQISLLNTSHILRRMLIFNVFKKN